MKTASITEAKNNLSKLIDGLEGGPVLILHRGRPVARLDRADLGDAALQDVRLAELERRGVIVRAKRPVPKGFFQRRLAPAPGGASVLRALLEEREEGR